MERNKGIGEKSKTEEVYVSTDVETDGPAPGLNSLLSFASAAYLQDKTLVGTFTANLEVLSGAVSDPKTMLWWEGQPEAWKACRENQRSPKLVMPEYALWLRSLPGKPIFIGYPAGFDFSFIYYYLWRFAGDSPFSFSAIDIKTYAMAMLKTPSRQTVKRNMPKEWFDPLPHTHVALDDAIEQGAMFINMLQENLVRGTSRA
jgi:hypothetical protein